MQPVMAKSALFHLESERLTEPRTAAREAWVSLLQCTLHAMWPGNLDFFPAQASMKAWSQQHSTATSPLARRAPSRPHHVARPPPRLYLPLIKVCTHSATPCQPAHPTVTTHCIHSTHTPCHSLRLSTPCTGAVQTSTCTAILC